ncbi:hypothetical protein AAC387_Pa04g2777 [Persea americana]
MWGDGGRFSWRRREECEKMNGIIVIFAWISSREKEIEPYVQLYASLGWNSLVCHPESPNLFFPEKATMLASGVLNELLKELKIRPLPIVFAVFSSGLKACMYKVLQIIEVKCGEEVNSDEYQLIRDCISGHIYDSSPVDFSSDLGSQLAHLPGLVSWITKAIASGLDAFFSNKFEAQRTEYWQTLYSSAHAGPFLIFCSEHDSLAPYQIICNFALHLQDFGCDVKLVKWSGSPHVGHYRHYPVNYKAAVADLLEKATVIYSQKRMHQLNGERSRMGGTCDKISESVCNLYQAAVSSNQSLRRVAIDPSDHFFLPSSVEYPQKKDAGCMQDRRKDRLIHLQDQPSISAHSVLGQVLFDVCVPKNIEDWDIKPACSLNRHTFGSSHQHSLNPTKCVHRSRL